MEHDFSFCSGADAFLGPYAQTQFKADRYTTGINV